MIPTLPLAARNRLAETILRAVRDGGARATLRALAAGETDGGAWLGSGNAGDLARLRERAARACEAIARVPLAVPACAGDVAGPGAHDLDRALDVAAVLFDAGLGFEVHELLEPYWISARGRERDALQGLIQIAVGYQHLANGNVAGARSLLAEGASRLDVATVASVELARFADAVRRAVARLPGPVEAPPFPTRAAVRGPNGCDTDIDCGRA